MSVATSTAIIIGGVAAAGASVAGSAIASHGNTEAAKTQAQATQAGIDELKREYDLERGDTAPYRQSGYGSLNALNYGLGLPAVDIPSEQKPANPNAPQVPAQFTDHLNALAQQGGTTGKLAGQVGSKLNSAQAIVNAGNGNVRIRNPQDGQIYSIPASQAGAAVNAGGVVVN
ncbi:MAG TPA: hypothetical protein VF443_07810 [Nitrospira sp.]